MEYSILPSESKPVFGFITANAGAYMIGTPGSLACSKQIIANTSQSPCTNVEIIVPGAVAPINGMGMMCTGMFQPFRAR
jgi:hypothetical protein